MWVLSTLAHTKFAKILRLRLCLDSYLLYLVDLIFVNRGNPPELLEKHGNRIHGDREFVRNDPEMMKSARKKVSNETPHRVYNQEMKNEDDNAKPRDLKAIQNLKHREKKKEDKAKETSSAMGRTLSDQYVQVANMVASPEPNLCQNFSISKQTQIPGK